VAARGQGQRQSIGPPTRLSPELSGLQGKVRICTLELVSYTACRTQMRPQVLKPGIFSALFGAAGSRALSRLFMGLVLGATLL